jgi:hypothetical protein
MLNMFELENPLPSLRVTVEFEACVYAEIASIKPWSTEYTRLLTVAL